MNAKLRKGVLVSVAVVALLAMVPLTALANHAYGYDGTASCEGFELHADIAGVVQLYWTASLQRLDGANWVEEDSHSNGSLGEEVYGPSFDYAGLWRDGLLDGEYRAVLQMSASDGSSWVDTILGITLPCSPPTAVTLASFDANATGSAIELAWETATELDTMGFNIYRAESAYGLRTVLNRSLIAGQAPGSPMGASYQFVDNTAQPGVTYYYWLQEVDTNFEAAEYGPVSAQLEVLARIRLARPRLAPTGGSFLTGY
jgi:hypothetical protein